MGLRGKLIACVEFKAGGDVFHELCSKRPHHVSVASPTRVQNCELHEGAFGKSGSKIRWTYTHDGKVKTAKQVITIDEKKKTIEFKMLEGDLMELYRAFTITSQVDTKGGIDTITWTLDYEKLNENIEEPITLLAFFIDLTKDIETHHLK